MRNFASSSILTSTIIRNLVDVYSDQERNRESQLPSGVEPRPSDQYENGATGEELVTDSRFGIRSKTIVMGKKNEGTPPKNKKNEEQA